MAYETQSKISENADLELFSFKCLGNTFPMSINLSGKTDGHYNDIKYPLLFGNWLSDILYPLSANLVKEIWLWRSSYITDPSHYKLNDYQMMKAILLFWDISVVCASSFIRL